MRSYLFTCLALLTATMACNGGSSPASGSSEAGTSSPTSSSSSSGGISNTTSSSSSSGGSQSSADSSLPAKDPATAPKASIDRFSDTFAHLFKRSANSSLPAANAPINFDQGAPFITHGFSPQGQDVTYYNFDVLPAVPAPIYVFFPEGSSTELTAQLHIVNAIPGDPGYNDFWQVVMVSVPQDYSPNSITSYAELMAAGYTLTPTNMLVNCPIVPAGSSAMLRYTSSEPAGLIQGWYQDQIIQYFTFAEHPLTLTASMVPTAPIYVTFTKNPNPSDSTSGPASGFETEPGTMQTHNVISATPEQPAYSPLWIVTVYDDADFAEVSNLNTVLQVLASDGGLLNPDAGLVNCPVVAGAGADGG